MCIHLFFRSKIDRSQKQSLSLPGPQEYRGNSGIGTLFSICIKLKYYFTGLDISEGIKWSQRRRLILQGPERINDVFFFCSSKNVNA